MNKQTEKIRDEIQRYRCDYGLARKKDCTPDENQDYKRLISAGTALPDGVTQYVGSAGEPTGWFYRTSKMELTDNEISEYFAYKQLDTLKVIKGCLIFFVVMSVISIVAGVIMGLSLL